MDEVYVYFIDLPNKINEVVTPCFDGYTIYINDKLDEIGRQKAYDHAMFHIINDDFNKEDVQEIEWRAHQ